ncbi:Cytosine permease [Caloramator mitchellensis]|uniref:Cytosine permease n=1 Tax=Caloramator mitchellensis TaxID=908809 RepID=A0A0R3JVT7_CALMK|nr:putative hydroxymethylpyrimidine transporter CytX [Caloramator mitchellensis]KRQ87633.1 Cytosine permease [Caloramator mitchellensis]
MKNKNYFYFFFLWFGAAVSVAEIMAGAYLGPLGMKKGILAVLIGHLIGCSILGITGIIGQEKDMTAMETIGISFGQYGRYIFSFLNLIQLVGWTAIMLITASNGLNQISRSIFGFENFNLWVVLVGILVYIWAEYGVGKYEYINNISVISLIILSVLMIFALIRKDGVLSVNSDGMSFGAAIELSAVMPISWLPLISDYTKFAKDKKSSFLGSFAGYFIGSSFMYIVGLICAIKFNEIDIISVLIKGNFGVVALLIVVLSTVTTTFLDVYSATISVLNIKLFNRRKTTILVVIVSILFAMFFKMEQYESFLYLIGAIFSPLFAVLISDYFILKIQNKNKDYIISFISFILGFVFYMMIKDKGTALGVTVPVMILTSFVSIILKKIGGVVYGNVKESM